MRIWVCLAVFLATTHHAAGQLVPKMYGRSTPGKYRTVTTRSPNTVSGKHNTASINEGELYHNLLFHYVKDVRPAARHDTAIQVQMSLVLMKLNDVIEKDQEISCSTFLKLHWIDEQLRWNPADFANISWFAIPAHDVWIPDIALVNAADLYTITRDVRYLVEITPTGDVGWYPAGTIVARCEMDLTFFPYDNQKCVFRFESWTYPVNYLNITLYGQTEIEFKHFTPNQQWIVTKTSATNYLVDYDGMHFSRCDFSIWLTRKTLFYEMFAIVPCIMLSILQMFSHFLPVDETERISFSTTILISFSVFHVSIVDKMPKSSDSIPVIAIYIDFLMAVICLSLVEAFVIFNCISEGRPVPRRFWYFVKNILGCLVFFKTDVSRSKKPSKKKQDTLYNDDSMRVDHLTDILYNPEQCCWQPRPGEALWRLQKQLTVLNDIRVHLKDKKKDKELRDQWITVFQIIDRYVFLCYFFINVFVPLLLFYWLPPAPEYAALVDDDGDILET